MNKNKNQLDICLRKMAEDYRKDPMRAVRSQSFIKILHDYLKISLESNLSDKAKKDKIEVKLEQTILGSHKSKDVDVSLMHPVNGPLMLIGIRSQMSSIGKNVLNYYEGIIGECISLQERFPLCVYGYVYLMPLESIKEERTEEKIDHERFARMYDQITGREINYKNVRGVYDQFSYMVVDFNKNPPKLLVRDWGKYVTHDLNIETFVNRIIETFKKRNFLIDYFI